jgi:nitroimidazol reductase NimA-like FMN-containing flavoprotein (pyridoxamine 5'-phosphate oxidase superfamily)
MELAGAEVLKGSGQPCDWGMSYRSVIGYGTAELIEAPEEKIRALGIIVKSVDERSFTFPEAEVRRTAVMTSP